MADRCRGLRARALCRGTESGEIRQLRRPPESSSDNPAEPASLEGANRKSILYRGSPPASTFRDNFIVTPVHVKAPDHTKSDRGSSVDWIDVVTWCFGIGAGVASGFLIDKGIRDDDAPLMATGEALATSVFMWGVLEASFRGTGAVHDLRGTRLGIALGTGALTGLSVWLGMKYNSFNFSMEGKTFSDDKKRPFVTFIPPRRVEYVPVIPNIKILPELIKGFKNPTSEWGP